ncbi:MAG: HDOD domain-containing protein [Magnetococcales bacterium]|nr:HDOD domain-containing protein [Magnetococcales bacterium]NGZ06995.1 HDOD domain-containing protein [Magnetococcales bacterium]
MGHSKKKLIRLVDGMPAFPPSVYHILKLTADINCVPKELVRVIDLDPVLTIKLLQLVNSPYFGLSRQIGSIRQAVVFVGINTIKNLALTIAPMEMLSRDTHNSPFLEGLLSHAIAVGVIARHLARRCGISEVESTDFFVAGLLHDFGKIALHRFFPNKYAKAMAMAAKKQISLIEAERHMLDLDHAQIGQMLADKWRLPPGCVASMGQHHQCPDPDTAPILTCVYAANIIAKTIGVGNSGNPVTETALPTAVEQCLGGSLHELIGTLGDLSGEMHKVQLFIHSWQTGSHLYSQEAP